MRCSRRARFEESPALLVMRPVMRCSRREASGGNRALLVMRLGIRPAQATPAHPAALASSVGCASRRPVFGCAGCKPGDPTPGLSTRTSQARGGPNLPRFSRASIRRDLEQARQRVPSAKPCFLLVRCVRSLLAHRVKSLAAQYLGRFCSESDNQRAALTGICEYAP